MKRPAIPMTSATEGEQLMFDGICRRILADGRHQSGIGTLGERTLHAILKSYLEPDSAYHEQKVGRYVADICRGEEIIEIQTRAFDKLKNKLGLFAKDYRVTVVYPIDVVKYLSWIHPETGEITSRRRSPKKGMHGKSSVSSTACGRFCRWQTSVFCWSFWNRRNSGR